MRSRIAWFVTSCGVWGSFACSSEPDEVKSVVPSDLSVVFTPTGGTFLAAETVELRVADPRAEVHYTLDGSLPSASSPKYEKPLVVTASTRITAVAIRTGEALGGAAGGTTSSANGGSGGRSSVGGSAASAANGSGGPLAASGGAGGRSADVGPIARESYLHVATDAATFTSHLPIVVIQTFEGGAINAESDRFVPAELQVLPAGAPSLVGRAELDARIGIHVRGETSRGFPKKQYSLEFWQDEANEDRDRAVLDFPEDSDFVLADPISMDRSLVRNALAFELSRRIGRYAPRTRFVEAFLIDDAGDVRKGKFLGLYTLTEKIKRGKSRVPVKKLEVEDVSEPNVSGGYLLRIDKGDQDFQAAGATFQFVYPDPEVMHEAARQPQVDFIKKYIDEFGKALRSSSHTNPTSGLHYREYIDQDAWIDHNILNTLLKNVDALRISAYLYKDRSGKLGAGPLWDFDRSAGTPYDERAVSPEEWKKMGTDGTDYFEDGLWAPLFDDPEFKARYKERFLALLGAELSEARLVEAVDGLVSQIGAAAERDFQRWPDSAPRNNSYATEVGILKDFLQKRAAWIRKQLQAWP